MEVKEITKVISIELTKSEAKKLRNACGDTQMKTIYGHEFFELLGNKLDKVLKN